MKDGRKGLKKVAGERGGGGKYLDLADGLKARQISR